MSTFPANTRFSRLRNIAKYFGNVTALEDISTVVECR